MYVTEREMRNGVVKSYGQRQDGRKIISGIVKYLALYKSIYVFKDGESSSIALPEDLKANLECPVCARIALPPIMQCRNGHVTCNPCRCGYLFEYLLASLVVQDQGAILSHVSRNRH